MNHDNNALGLIGFSTKVKQPPVWRESKWSKGRERVEVFTEYKVVFLHSDGVRAALNEEKTSKMNPFRGGGVVHRQSNSC